MISVCHDHMVAQSVSSHPRHGMAWRGVAWHAMACHGVAWRGMAWHAVLNSGTLHIDAQNRGVRKREPPHAQLSYACFA